MLTNIHEIDNLRSLARSYGRAYETKTVHPRLVEEAVKEGWTEDKKNKQSVRLKRLKSHGIHFEHRVWSLLYRMGFSHLSGAGGGNLFIAPKDPDGPKTKIDVVGIDQEIAIAIECKSSEKAAKRPQFQEELGKHSLIKLQFSAAVNSISPGRFKRQTILAMFLQNIILSDNDKERARQANVLLFDEKDLFYYTGLTNHLGPAAKYQFFADILPGKTVPGLAIRVPAVRTKMGGFHCYTFSISPEYLLKISYVSHRSKGKASDIDTYQRMLTRSRLSKIRQYITEDGLFPTNVVVNLDNKRLNFERVHQDAGEEVRQESGVLGWLDIRPTYKSAWIIDGQHRLFAYSGHERASKSLLSVLAFEGLPPSEQARLFIDINSKQKRVKQSLLQELHAELHWNAEDPTKRVSAIISKAIQVLDDNLDSALHQRIQKADETKDAVRCISLTSVYSAIEKTGFHIAKEKHGHVLEYGPLWAGDNQKTLNRTVYLLKKWFGVIRGSAKEWWDKGSGEGGGLAMNDGVTTCINVLRSVFQHLDAKGQKLLRLDDEDLFDAIKAYATALGDFFGSLPEEERRKFRDLRGIQGQATRTRRCQQAIRVRFPSFNPLGLDDFIQREKAQTNIRAKEIIDRIETTMQKVILDEVRREFGAADSEWWLLGIPKNIRLKVTERFEQDDGKRGIKEHYFNLLDYKKIIIENWTLFESLFAYGNTGNKDKRTAWIDELNDKRNAVAHASSGSYLSIEELGRLQDYEEWLTGKLLPSDNQEAAD